MLNTNRLLEKGSGKSLAGKRTFSKNSMFIVCIYITLIIVDFLNFKGNYIIGFSEIMKNKTIVEFLGVFNKSTVISQGILTIVVTVLSIFFAVYFVVIQTSRNRYPLDSIKTFYKENLMIVIEQFSINVFIGLFLITLTNDFVLTKLAYCIHSLYCFWIFVRAFQRFNQLEPAAIIDEIKNDIKKSVNKLDTKNPDTNKLIKQLREYSEESFSRGELVVTKYILDVYKELVVFYIKNKNRLIIDNDKSDKVNLDSFDDQLFGSILLQFKSAMNYGCTDYFEYFQIALKEIIRNCIVCDELEIYKRYCNKLGGVFSYSIRTSNVVASIYIIGFYSFVSEMITDKELNEEWVVYISKVLRGYGKNTSLQSEIRIQKQLFTVYSKYMCLCLKEERLQVHDLLVKDMIVFLKSVTVKSDGSLSNFLKSMLFDYTGFIVGRDHEQILKRHIENMNDLAKYGFYFDIRDLCEIVIVIYDFIEEKTNKSEIKQEIIKYKCEYALLAIDRGFPSFMIFVPDYYTLLETQLENYDIFEKIIDDYDKLMYRAYVRKNAKGMLFILSELRKIVLLFNSSKIKQQKRIVDFYQSFIINSIEVKYSESFHLVFEEYNNTIKKMEENNLISEEVIRHIMGAYRVIGIKCISNKVVELGISTVERCSQLIEVLKLKGKKYELTEELIEILFQLALNGVENGDEDIIKAVSNQIGWIGFNAMIDGRTEILRCSANKAAELLNICRDYDVSEKTIVYNGTLFVILGAKSCFMKNEVCKKHLIDSLTNICDTEFLQKSKRIRVHDDHAWDDVMGHRARHYMECFVEEALVCREERNRG